MFLSLYTRRVPIIRIIILGLFLQACTLYDRDIFNHLTCFCETGN
jgi:hypothetical protein